MIQPLLELPTPTLRSLVAALRAGRIAPASLGVSLSRSLGASGSRAEAPLRRLFDDGMTPAHVATLLEAVLETRSGQAAAEQAIELVLSGPDVPGIQTGDTAATMRRLIDEAKAEVLLVGYALNNVRDLFERLAKRLESDPAFRVVLCFDIARPRNDTSMESEIVRRFAHDFRKRHWPWPSLPELFYDPRALDTNPKERATLHAKCVVTDRSRALITSANFTEAAQRRNIEAGVLVSGPALCARLAGYFEALRAGGALKRCDLPG
jgi:phosphatidylserine/phosphatidylglycerophosphate/cardiolipin synthase-like enzyme